MRRHSFYISLMLASVAGALTLMGATPQQGERPPQPFFQDFLSGQVLIQGEPAPPGLILVACIDDCSSGYESNPVVTGPGGRYQSLEINPLREGLIGHMVSFYLVNEFGRIKAAETRGFVGVFDFYTVDLTFDQPMPLPTPTPTITPKPTLTPTASLPVPGDPRVAAIPRLALFIGAGAVVVGIALIAIARRWPEGQDLSP